MTKHPYFLKEGDLIGLRSEAAEDDWQTEEDKLKKELWEKEKQQTRDLMKQAKSAGGNKVKSAEPSIKIGNFWL